MDNLVEAQPAPIINDSSCVWDLVISDMKSRDEVGRKRYGTPLQTFNGRNAIIDMFQELLDLSVYTKQLLLEWESEEQQAKNILSRISNQECLGKEDVLEVSSFLKRFIERRSNTKE